MRIGRNSPCPCGSGRKFKLCCLPKLQVVETAQVSVPFLALPVTFQMVISVNGDEIGRDAANFWPLCVVGTTADSVNFHNAGTEIERDQLLRIGFCNREYRLLIQVRTGRKSVV